MTRWACLGAVVLLTSVSSPALAEPTKRECIDINAQAQVEIKAGSLRSARRLLQSCEVRACPAPVRKDCTDRLDALAPRIPSIVVEAKDPTGKPLTAVTVRMDGEVLTARLDGTTAIELDPGEHHFVFEAADAPAVERTIVFREGEARREKVVLGKPAAAAIVANVPATSSSETTTTTTTTDRGHGQRVAGLALGGVGVAGLVVGSVLGVLASSKNSDAKKDCASSSDCTHRERAVDENASAHHLATGSTVGFVVGGVLVAGGVVLYLTAPTKSAPLGIAPTPNGAVLVGRF